MTVLEIRGPGPDEGAESGLGRTIDTEGRRNLKRETILKSRRNGWLLLRRQEYLGIFIGPATFA